MEPLEYRGKYTACKVFTDAVEQSAVAQIYGFLNCEVFDGSKIRIMPDVHAGKGAVIGFTSPINMESLKVIPNVIGVDIGCFAGETHVRLLDGQDHPIQSLVGKTFLVYASSKDGRVVIAEATAKRTRQNASLMAVQLDNGEVIRCTLDQKFMLRDGTYQEAQHLAPHTSLMPLYTKSDADGYTMVQQNYSGKWQRAHWMVARDGHMGDIPKFEGQRTVIHHKDFTEHNNAPDNLVFMGDRDHSKYHRGLVDRNTHWQSTDFEERRIAKLHELSATRPSAWYDKKVSVGTSNLKAAEEANPVAFIANYIDAGRRGAPTLSALNKDRNSIPIDCPDCGKTLRRGGLGNHRKAHQGIANPGMEASRIKSPCTLCGKPMGKNNMPMHMRKHEREHANYNHKVVSITPIAETEDVYCLTVPEWSNFALSAGVFVHNCGVQSIQLTNQKSDKIRSRLPEFDRYLRSNVASLDRPSKRRQWLYQWYFGKGSDWDTFEADLDNLATRVGSDASRVWCQCGSLGGGNHFIEIGKGDDDSLWLTVHSGSRNLGLKVATFHQKKAVDRMGKKGGLEWLEGEEAKMYLRDMRLAQKFAMLNRLVMLDTLVDFYDLKIRDVPLVTSVHNFIGDDNIIRKGAISANEGENVIIPWNMADGIVLGVGKGNEDWNNSAPHGAGRTMSRGDAKRSIPMADYKQVMKDADVWSSCVSNGTLDEAPQAYKPASAVLAFVQDTISVTNSLKPVYNFKAGGEPE